MSCLLGNDVEVFLIFEGLINLDDLRMVKGCQNTILIDNILGILNKFLLDALNGPHQVRVIPHFSLVNSGKCTTADDLYQNGCT